MKKWLLAALLFAVMLCANALAENRHEGMIGVPMDSESQTALMPSEGGSAPAVEGEKNCVTGQEYTWKATGFADESKVRMFIAVKDHSYENANTADVQYQPREATTSITYTFYLPGTYVIFAAKDSTWKERYYLTVNVQDAGENALTRKVAEVREENPMTSKRDRVLWYHDWIIDHCVYDRDSVYYSAADLLLNGTGVCNSYVRAFALLLDADDIFYRRISGKDSNKAGHTWIAVCIDDEWCIIDPTWDDTDKGSTGAAKAFFRHAYYGVTEELIAIEHNNAYYIGGSVTCDSMANCYIVPDVLAGDSVYAPGLLSALQTRLASGQHWFLLEAPYYTKGQSGTANKLKYYRQMQLEATVWALKNAAWQDGEGRSFTAEFIYNTALDRLIGRDTDPGSVLTLPGSLEKVEARAFEQTGANVVVLPSGCESIGENAFAGMDLWAICIPDSVNHIDDNAFAGSNGVFIVANEGSTAAQFAADKGIDTWPDVFNIDG